MDQKKAHKIASGLRKAQEGGVLLHETESIIVIEDAEIQRLTAEIERLQQTVNDWRGQVDVENLQGMEWKDKAEKAEVKIKQQQDDIDSRINGTCQILKKLRKAETEIERWRKEVEYQAYHQDETDFQRKHRKWALGKARANLRGWNDQYIGQIALIECAEKAEVQRDELLDALIGLRRAIEEETFQGQPSYHSEDVKGNIGMANAAIIHTTGKTWNEIKNGDTALKKNNQGGKP